MTTLWIRLEKNEKARTFLQDTWKFLERIEVMGTRVGTSGTPTVLDDPSIEQFSYSVAKTVKRIVDGSGIFTTMFDGLIILIDETDRAGADLNLGSFTKNLVERLHRQRCDRFVLGMAGLPDVLKHLAEGHESAPRLFQHVELSRLSRPEADEVIRRGLETARVRNKADIGINDKATMQIIDLVHRR